MDLVAVLDVGKTNVKLSAFAPDHSVPWRRAMPNAPRRGGPYDAVDVGAIWNFLLDGLAAMAREGTVADVIATTHGCAFAALGPDMPGDADADNDVDVDADGLVLPVMDYEWPGVRAHDASYDALRPPFAETGSPALPMGLNGGRQLHFLMREHPDAWRQVRAVLPLPQYFAWRLCAVAASDVSSLGCHSDLWAPHEGTPSSLARRLGLDRLLAPLHRADAVLGAMRPALAARLGLAAPPRVRVGMHDSNASLAPYLDAGAPMALASTGTWAIVFAVGGEKVALDERRDCLLNIDVNGTPVPSARAMLGREFALVAGEGAEAALEDAARVVAADALLAPSFVPGVGPFPDQAGGGTEHPALATPSARHAAASLYAALTLRTMLALTGARGPVVLDGPLAADPIVAPALATLVERPVRLGAADASEGCARLVRGAGPPPACEVAPDPRLAALRRRAERWPGSG